MATQSTPGPESTDERTAFEKAGDSAQLGVLAELWLFIKENKAWWLVPIVLVMGLLGLLVALGATGAAPFIYTLF